MSFWCIFVVTDLVRVKYLHMIKANELRIGNLVKDRGGKTLRIDFIEYMEMGYQSKIGQRMFLEGEEVHAMTEYTDYAEPIQLTPEWLNRLGFATDGEGFRLSGAGYWVEYLDGVWCLYVNGIERNELDDDIDMMLSVISNVHHLQNLLFVIGGIELTINL